MEPVFREVMYRPECAPGTSALVRSSFFFQFNDGLYSLFFLFAGFHQTTVMVSTGGESVKSFPCWQQPFLNFSINILPEENENRRISANSNNNVNAASSREDVWTDFCNNVDYLVDRTYEFQAVAHIFRQQAECPSQVFSQYGRSGNVIRETVTRVQSRRNEAESGKSL